MPEEHSIANAGPVAVAPQLLEAGHLDLALGELDRLARARQRVRPLAADLDRRVRRRALADPPGRQHERLGAASGRARARPRGRRWSTSTPAGRPSRSASAAPSGSAARASRARRARAAARSRTGRASPRGPTLTPRPSARRTSATTSCEVTPGRLVDQEDAVDRVSRAARRARARRNSTSSANSRSVEKPAARRWPPPPSARAIARDVDAVVGRAQRDLARGRAVRAGRARARRRRCPRPSAGGRRRPRSSSRRRRSCA